MYIKLSCILPVCLLSVLKAVLYFTSLFTECTESCLISYQSVYWMYWKLSCILLVSLLNVHKAVLYFTSLFTECTGSCLVFYQSVYWMYWCCLAFYQSAYWVYWKLSFYQSVYWLYWKLYCILPSCLLIVMKAVLYFTSLFTDCTGSCLVFYQSVFWLYCTESCLEVLLASKRYIMITLKLSKLQDWK